MPVGRQMPDRVVWKDEEYVHSDIVADALPGIPIRLITMELNERPAEKPVFVYVSQKGQVIENGVKLQGYNQYWHMERLREYVSRRERRRVNDAAFTWLQLNWEKMRGLSYGQIAYEYRQATGQYIRPAHFEKAAARLRAIWEREKHERTFVSWLYENWAKYGKCTLKELQANYQMVGQYVLPITVIERLRYEVRRRRRENQN